MFAKSKVSQSMIDAVNQVVETAPIKEPTPTGMRVYGGSYGNSAKAKQDQTRSSVDDLKEPTKKDIEKDSKIYKKTPPSRLKSYNQFGAHMSKNEEVGVVEAAKPDFLDMDKDGNKKESMKKAIADKKAMGEELKGNQDKIDANHNNKIDSQDFKILRAKKKVSEDMHFANKLLEAEKTKSPAKNQDVADKSYLKDKPGSVKSDLKNLGRFLTGKKETNEEVELTEEQLDEMINEVLGKDASAGDYIHDFIHSDNPKFAGKSKAERKKMALGAYYGKQNEEADANCTTDTLAGRLPGGKINSFKSYKKKLKGDLESDPEENKPESTPARASVHAEATIAGTSGWEPMRKDAKDKSGAVHTPMSRARDLAKSALKRVQDKTKIK
jgi:hypothetical protein